MKTKTKKRFIVYHLNERPRGMVTPPRFTNSTYTLTAIVEATDLDEVFRLTNSIDSFWGANPEVKWHLGPECRSTSVGDVVLDENAKGFLCESIGWKKF